MDIFQKINQFIQKYGLIQSGHTIIIGLSGGPDSVFLFHLLIALKQKYNLTLIAAHLNHEWRSEADHEEELCRSLAKAYDIPFISTKISSLLTTIKKKYDGSKEEYARSMRRTFLEQVLRDYNADFIVLGHHAQDQQETFFIRLMRGTSLAGLTGMNPQQGVYIRPLLETNKKDILAWLDKNSIVYATDASNNSLDYLRNRIRSKVLPALVECDERWDDNFLETVKRLKQDNELLENIAYDAFADMTTIKEEKFILDTIKLTQEYPFLRYRIIVLWLIQSKVKFPPTQAFLDEIIRFLCSEKGGKHSIHESWALIKKQNKAQIEYQ